jgi:2-dehydro-3-deoxyphosphogluconate aldolase/(4S)-4-hydroxy-2-oxoglutarate aldolase
MTDALEVLAADRIAAVVRAPAVADPAALADTLAYEGIRCVEFTFTIPDTPGIIARAARAGTEAVIGAGTVMTVAQAAAAVDAGARFLVSPCVVPELAEFCRARDVRLFLGAHTPTEVASAIAVGSDAVKLFPASIGGPTYIRDLLGPFPEARLIPSGGVDADTIAAYLSSGAIGAFAGADLVPPASVQDGDHADISSRARQLTAALPR